MQQGLTTQQIQASHVAFAQGRKPVVLGDETTSASLRDNLRQRRVILDAIFTAAQQGDEAETLRLASELTNLRNGVIVHPASQAA